MLQPDKLKKLNENALKMSEAGKSKEEILAMKDAFIQQFGTTEPVKKKRWYRNNKTYCSKSRIGFGTKRR